MIFNSINSRLFKVSVITLLASPALAHEYWLDPIYSSINAGDTATVDIRNGQDYSGAAFPYNGNRYQSITVTNETDRIPYTARLGDYPAIHPRLSSTGLHSISVDTQPTLLTYDSWQKFTTFLDYHGLTTVAQQHLQRELPKSQITERYVRSAKTLIHVNAVEMAKDKKNTAATKPAYKALSPTNSLFEMILLNNPFNEQASVSAKLLYEGKPLAGRQVELFWKGNKTLRMTKQSNELGIVTFQMMGKGDYLLNAVQMAQPDTDDVHWLSYWASFTFEL